jgi:hypothetical protein
MALWGCGRASVGSTSGPITTHGPTLTLSMAGAVLAGDCAVARSFACAQNVPNCGCQQSTVQLKIVAAQGQGVAGLQVTHVRVLTADGSQQLDDLTARTPQKWNGSAYVDWDQQVHPGDDFTASYQTSAPNWAQIAPNGMIASYRVEVDLLVDGQAVSVALEGVSRAPLVST